MLTGLTAVITYFALRTKNESLCCLPETNIMLHVSDTSMKNLNTKKTQAALLSSGAQQRGTQEMLGEVHAAE